MSLKEVAKEVVAVLEEGAYAAPSGASVDIGSAISASEAGTRLFRPEELYSLADALPTLEAGERAPIISVTDERTQVAAHRLAKEQGSTKRALLNFASARNPGGGFIKGAKAQEEDLSRVSGLYRCLLTAPDFYEANRRQTSLLYTDHIIYSPDVPFFKEDGRGPYLESFFNTSIITAPAPNAGEYLRRKPSGSPAVRDALRRRARYVLTVAATMKQRLLILGAWGCGVFRNDPVEVCRSFLDELLSDSFRGYFDEVVFAVFDPSKEQRNLRAFRETVQEQSRN